MDRAQILVVEDEAVVALDIQSKLEDLGYSVIALIRSGEEAVQCACEMRPDLILMDINLQGEMDGISAAAHIQERNPTPVVYLTANGDKDTLHRATMTEPLGFIMKPIAEQALRAAIEVALNKHHMVVTREAAQREHAKETVHERTVELAQRHRELAALNTAFQKHLKVRDEEARDCRELRLYVKGVVSRIQKSLDELNINLQGESFQIGPLPAGNPMLDIPVKDAETSSKQRNGHVVDVELTGLQ
jgi:CheY-like chemotaxis protein